MYVGADFIENKELKRLIQHIFYVIFLSISIPLYWYFEIHVVLPTIVQNVYLYYLHVSLGLFLLVNIVGNLVFGALENTSINGRVLPNVNKKDWSFCSVCETLRPPRSWHCKLCGTCILKRDHHCAFIATCVGHFNQRYFFFLSFYCFVATAVMSIYNILYVAQSMEWDGGHIINKFAFPMVYLVLDFGMESITILLVVMSFLIFIFSAILVKFHFKIMLVGKVTPELKKRDGMVHEDMYDNGWKNNLRAVFGTRWYLAWILPFIKSPLPGNGIEWDHNDKYK